MQLKNSEVFAAIDVIGEHYRTNISNRFTRRALSTMSLDAGTWALIEELVEKAENYKYQGYHLDELYGQILAIARFVYQARRQVAPNLRFMASSGAGDRVNPADKVFRDMAINNFAPNLKILADMVNELYVKVAAFDKAGAGIKPTTLSQMPELREVGRYLVE
jgi:hypothetical protein